MRHDVSLLSLGIASLVTMVMGQTPVARASPLGSFSPVPDAASYGDLGEDEGEGGDSDPNSVANERLAAEVATVPPREIRGMRTTEVSLGLGRVKPWQGASLEVGSMVRSDLLYGLYAGGGSFNIYGDKIADKSYDMSMQSRSAGGVVRYFFSKFELLAVEASVGLATWRGHIAPRGSDDTSVNQQEKLTDSFHAIGLTAGVAGSLNWIWPNGCFIDWTVAGLQAAKVLKRDFSRADAGVSHVVTHDIEALRIYGIVDLKLGYQF